MGYIYIIKSHLIVGVYIGQTTKTIEIRWTQHKRKATLYINATTEDLINKLNGKKQRLYLAMSTYGIENFEIDMIEEISNDQLNAVEAKYISEHNSVDNGLNMRRGFSGTNTVSEETKKTISERTRIAFKNLEIIKKMRKHQILDGLPFKCGYHKNNSQEGIRVRRHQLCDDKLFEFKNYRSVDECKQDVIKFITDLEATGIKYIGGHKKNSKLPKGMRRVENGYRIQKTFNKKRHTKSYHDKDKNDEAKFSEAFKFLNDLLQKNNIPQLVANYDDYI